MGYNGAPIRLSLRLHNNLELLELTRCQELFRGFDFSSHTEPLRQEDECKAHLFPLHSECGEEMGESVC